MSRRPNILLITTDQQHWDTLGCRNPEIQTPSLDALAEEGTLFERAYCPNPTCTPTRASIITGQYPSQHGAWTLGTMLDPEAPTLNDVLGPSGYRTALIGKAHFQPLQEAEGYRSLESYPTLHDLPFWRRFTGPYYGFEYVQLCRNHADEAHAGEHYGIWMEEKGLGDWRDYFRPDNEAKKTGDGGRTWLLPQEFHYNEFIVERSAAKLEEYAESDEPFFLWASFPDPHCPYLVPEPWASMYDPNTLTVPQGVPGEHANNPPHFQLTQEDKPDFSAWKESGYGIHGMHSHTRSLSELAKDLAVYYGMMSYTDDAVGRLLRHLEALGLAEETVVVFTTDHGMLLGQHGLSRKGPFHYEDLVKLPFIVRYPGRVPSGRSSNALQSLVDLAPTFLSFADLPIPPRMSGVDQKGVWLGNQEQARDHVVIENRHEPTTIHVKTYVDSRFKLTVYYNQPYGELFDLKNDPGEFKNLWNDPESQTLKAELIKRLLFAEMGKEPLYMPRISGA